MGTVLTGEQTVHKSGTKKYNKKMQKRERREREEAKQNEYSKKPITELQYIHTDNLSTKMVWDRGGNKQKQQDKLSQICVNT